jgi:hypothetical protein
VLRVRVGWKKLHNKEFDTVYPPPNMTKIITLRKTRWTVHIARTHGKMRNAYNVCNGNPEGKRALGRPKRRGEGNIKRGFWATG